MHVVMAQQHGTYVFITSMYVQGVQGVWEYREYSVHGVLEI